MPVSYHDDLELRVGPCPLCNGQRACLEMVWNRFRLVRCYDCDLVYSDPLEVPATLYDEAYDHHAAYQGYLREARSTATPRLHVAWAWRHFFGFAPTPGRLLDVGCATGSFMRVARNRGWSPQGVDVSPAAAAIAREVAGAETHAGTLEACRFPSDSFDAVTAWEVLEHVPSPKAFMAEIYRILRPGGRVALPTPNWRSPWEQKTQDDNRRPPYHLTFWSAEPGRRLLFDTGFGDTVAREKPFAWSEEVGKLKWFYLPVAIVRSVILHHRGNRLLLMGVKPPRRVADVS
jgi:SAM-dependent methyltransferase